MARNTKNRIFAIPIDAPAMAVSRQSGDQTEDQKRKRPMQHGNLPLSVSVMERQPARPFPCGQACDAPETSAFPSGENPYTDDISTDSQRENWAAA